MNRLAFNDRVVAAARGWVGTSYHHQQSSKGHGADCLGLVRGVWREVCGEEREIVPNYGSSWKSGQADLLISALRRNLEPVAEIKAGRVLAFRYRQGLPVHHVAIATSAQTMIHAYHQRAVFEVEIIPFWKRKLVACFEFPLEDRE